MRNIVGFICLFLAFAANAAAEVPEPIKIGVTLPLTGDGATFGEDLRKAIAFANDKLGGGKYELLVQDDKCDPLEAVKVARFLINVKKVRYMIGFACSGVTLAVAPVLKKSNVLAMVTGASSPKISELGDNVFRTHPSDDAAADELADYIAAHGTKKLAILSSQAEYTQDFKTAFLHHYPVELPTTLEEYLPDATEMRTQITKLRATGADALFINAQYEKTFALILKQLDSISWRPKIFGAYYPSSATLIADAGPLLNGVEFVDLPDTQTLLTAEGREYFNQFRSANGVPRSYEMLFVTGFEGFRTLSSAIQEQEAGKDPVKYLEATTFHGLTGDYTFDRNGDIQGLRYVMKRIRDGKPERIE